MRPQLTSLFVIAISVVSAPSRAQTPSPKPGATAAAPSAESAADEARKLFEEGTELLNASRFAEAADKLRAAWAKKKSYDVAGNLGTALMQIGKHAEAARLLAFALENFPAGGSPKEKKWVTDMFADVRKQVLLVRVHVTIEGADVLVNGEAIGKSPTRGDIYVAGGPVIVVAKKDGFEDARVEVKGDRGGAVDARVVMKPKGAAAPAAQMNPWIIGAGAGLTAVGLAIGIGSTIGAGEKASSADKQLASIRATSSACTSPPANGACSDLLATREEQRTFQNLAFWSFIGSGAAALGTGLYVLVMRRTAPAQVTAGPTVGSDGGGFVVRGTW